MLRRAVFYSVLALLMGSACWHLGDGLWIHGKAWLAQRLVQRAWAVTLDRGLSQRPWPWADTRPVARLIVPRLAVDQIVLDGATGRTLAFGPGLVAGTAVPGSAGATVISGHRDTHFAWLRHLRSGDVVRVITDTGAPQRYRVVTRRVYDTRKGGLYGDPMAPALYLTTCYPFDALDPGGPLRLVLKALPVSKV